MMKILFVNPNSSLLITQKLDASLERFRSMETCIDAVSCPAGPPAIVTVHDELLSGLEALKLIKSRESDYEGAVIACFADPGLAAAREQLAIPVTGLYESACVFARLAGARYSIVASGDHRDVTPWMRSVQAYGELSHLASVRCLDSTVEGAVYASHDELADVCRDCIELDGADAVILGCAAFAGRGRELEADFGVPVLDGIGESINIVKAMASYRKER